MFGIDLALLGALINQSFSATIAIVAGSFFLYSLTRNIRNRVAWSSSAVLLFVAITYIGDLGVSYSAQLSDAEVWLRLQWAGIAFVPAGYVHLSHSLLDLTGTPSRGRRRRFAALTYLLALIFFVLGISSDLLVEGVVADPAPHMQAGPVFWVFVLFFCSAVITSFTFIIRARRRSISSSTRRRMTVLFLPYTAPALAVFPFLAVASPSLLNSPIIFNLVLATVDVVLVFLLVALAYTLTFFSSLLPDRVVKAQMMQFLLRGPLVAISALAVIIWVPRAGRFLGLPGQEIMPFLAIAVILLLQWAITLARPLLERIFIYTGEQVEISRIKYMERRLLTGTDFKQLLESILAALCDYLRVPTAFILSLGEDEPRLEFAVGLRDDLSGAIVRSSELSAVTLELPDDNVSVAPALVQREGRFLWNGFWLVPLRYSDPARPENASTLVGLLGVIARDDQPFDEDQTQVFDTLVKRAAEALGDRRMQVEAFSALEGLLPKIEAMQRLRGQARYGGVEALTQPAEALLEHPDYSSFVKDALSHYWGGPKLTDSKLMNLAIVRKALDEYQGNPQRALRSVLLQAIERLKPSGKRSMTTTEWIMYNILELRFVQGRKVRDVALRLAMSESDLYRKQRHAIEAVGRAMADMERAAPGDNQVAQSLQSNVTS